LLTLVDHSRVESKAGELVGVVVVDVVDEVKGNHMKT